MTSDNYMFDIFSVIVNYSKLVLHLKLTTSKEQFLSLLETCQSNELFMIILVILLNALIF